MKKKVAVLLAMAMTAGVLSGCGGRLRTFPGCAWAGSWC